MQAPFNILKFSWGRVAQSVCVNDKCFHVLYVPPLFSYASRNDKEDVDGYNDNINADGDGDANGDANGDDDGVGMGMPQHPEAA